MTKFYNAAEEAFQ